MANDERMRRYQNNTQGVYVCFLAPKRRKVTITIGKRKYSYETEGKGQENASWEKYSPNIIMANISIFSSCNQD